MSNLIINPYSFGGGGGVANPNEVLAANWDSLSAGVSVAGAVNEAGNGDTSSPVAASGCVTAAQAVGDYSVVMDATPAGDGCVFNNQGDDSYSVSDAIGSTTIEMIVRLTSLSGSTQANNNHLLTTRPPINARNWVLRHTDTGVLELIGWNTSGANTLNLGSGANTLAINTDYHIAMVRDGTRDWEVYVGECGSTNSLWISGSQSGEVADTANADLDVMRSGFSGSRFATGYCGAVRITHEVLYSSTFTALSALPGSG